MRRRISNLCHRVSSRTDKQLQLKENTRHMAGAESGSASSTITGPSEVRKSLKENELQSGFENNIIKNPNFSEGLHNWHANSCHAHVVSGGHGVSNGAVHDSRGSYIVVTKRTQCWQGLEQDITDSISPDSNYTVTALVRVSGSVQDLSSIKATLRLEYEGLPTEYLFLGSVSVSKERWEKLNGSFSLTSLPKRVVFYLEGPSPGVDLLINSIAIFSSNSDQKETRKKITVQDDENIIQNPRFEEGLNGWSGRGGCKILLHDSMGDGKILPLTGKVFTSATERSQSWNGIQQEITGRVQRKLAYEVTAIVRVFGSSTNVDVRATLWVQAPNGREQYIGIANMQASDAEWVQLQGKFLLNSLPSKAVIFLEGPPPGVDILINSLVVKHAEKVTPLPPPDFEKTEEVNSVMQEPCTSNIIVNHDFSHGLHYWHPNSCKGHVVSEESDFISGVAAKTGEKFAVVSNRTAHWQGLEQDITENVLAGHAYALLAWVRVLSTHEELIEVKATLKLKSDDSRISYLSVGRALATTSQWTQLEGHFLLAEMPKQAIFYLEGPPPAVDLLIDSVIISSCSLKKHENAFGANILVNSCLSEGLCNWYPLGSCTLKQCSGSPRLLPQAAKDSLGQQKILSGQYLLITDRTDTWMGPAQSITERLKLNLTYQVSAWVRVGLEAAGPQPVNVAVGVDDDWVNGGHVEVDGDRWYELAGSFRIEKKPSKVIVYVQGPSPGVDLMVAGLQIFPVNRRSRFVHLKNQTDKVRKRDVVLRFSGLDFGRLQSIEVKVQQIKSSFPFGACISRSNIDNEDFVDFFLKNFNWAVFGNELKWYHTEPEQGKFNYTDADEMLDFCKRHGIETRGHCIFWEVKDSIQPWVQSLNIVDLMTAVQNRLTGLLTRYKGQFQHYDVNNEMLHGSFYRDRLGTDITAYMFKAAHQLDPAAKLFVNDYHVEDGCDSKSSPEMYIQQILDLQGQAAPIGGIGIQGHINHPVGSVICSALDKLAILGLPIWFTELDVSAENEHVRADDLEVMLREAYAHPAVEGVVLWGFWEIFTCRDCSHLVNAEGDINEAGKRYLDLRQEWMSRADGPIDKNGEFKFRGFHGTYTIEIITPSKKISETIVVEKGDFPSVITIKL